MRRLLLSLVGTIGFLALAASAGNAHHGWSWTTGGNIDLTGIIQSARLGNPHGVVTVDADGKSGRLRSASPGATIAPASRIRTSQWATKCALSASQRPTSQRSS